LQSPSKSEEFDFKDYLARQGIYSVVSYPKDVLLLDTGKKPKHMQMVYSFRNEMAQSLDSALPDPQCSLAKAMLLGQRGSISPGLREDFSKSGTSHLLAISGVHVSIIAGIILSAGIWLFGRRRPTYFLLALAVVWGYALLTGMRPSAMRASIMVSLWLYADRIGRPRSAFTALAFAAAIMLAIDPQLLSDVGFQLSFAAMAGLIFLTPVFHDWGNNLCGLEDGKISPVASFVIGSFAVTMGAVFATLPLVAYYFGLISLLSLPATFFALPAVPGVIITSSLVGITGIFSPLVAEILGWITWLFASYVIEVAKFFADLPFSSVDVEVTAPMMGGYYGILVCLIWVPSNTGKLGDLLNRLKGFLRRAPEFSGKLPARLIIVTLVVISALVWVAALTISDNRLHVFVLDVGQGDSILISKGSSQILVDGGPSPDRLSDELEGKLPFWDRTIELVVLTHPDADHLAGLVEVLQRYKVSKILTSGQETETDLYRQWRRLIDEKGIERVVAKTGQRVTLGSDIELAVLHPSGDQTVKDKVGLNENSVVLRLECGRFSMFLTGDAGQVVEKSLLDQSVKLRSTVLKVSHHGSNTGTSPEFLSEVKPELAVISVGEDNKFGHPTGEVMSRLQSAITGESIYMTSQRGTIELVTDGETLWLK